MATNKYQKKVQELDSQYGLALGSMDTQVAAKLEQAKAEYGSDESWLAAIDSIVMNVNCNPLAVEIKKKIIAESKACPVCGDEGQPITLMGNREAYYCTSHRVVSPVVKESES